MSARTPGLAKKLRRQKKARTLAYRNEESLAKLKLTILRYTDKLQSVPASRL
jgi:hypothetical protein